MTTNADETSSDSASDSAAASEKDDEIPIHSSKALGRMWSQPFLRTSKTVGTNPAISHGSLRIGAGWDSDHPALAKYPG